MNNTKAFLRTFLGTMIAGAALIILLGAVSNMPWWGAVLTIIATAAIIFLIYRNRRAKAGNPISFTRRGDK